MARTKTYANFLERYARLCGIDSLSDDEKEFALQYAQSNLSYAWEAYYWPFTCLIEERTPDADNVIEYDQAGETEIGTVFTVFKYDPFGTQGQVTIGYQLTADGIQFFENDTPDPAYVYFREAVPTLTGDPTQTMPADLFEYVCRASYSDFLNSNEQAANGLAMRNMAESILLTQIEKYEKQSQFRPLQRFIYTHGTEQLRN